MAESQQDPAVDTNSARLNQIARAAMLLFVVIVLWYIFKLTDFSA